jgi:signal transduction histidine kinase
MHGPTTAELVECGRLVALGELAAGTAHEINNPLFAILGLVELLLREAEPGTKAHERLLLIQETGYDLKDIVRALLDFARAGSDGFTSISLGETVGRAVELVRRTSAVKSIELVEEYPDEPVFVVANANQVAQTVVSFLSNVRRASNDRGTITVSVAVADGCADLSVRSECVECALDGFGATVGALIAELHGGELVTSDGTLRLRLPIASA